MLLILNLRKIIFGDSSPILPLDKNFFLSELKHISKTPETRGVYRSDLRDRLFKKYPGRKEEITTWLKEIVKSNSDITLRIEALNGLELIDFDKIPENLKDLFDDRNTHVRDTAIEIVVNYVRQRIEYKLKKIDNREVLLKPYLERCNKEIVLEALADLVLDSYDSDVQRHALLAMKELSSEGTIDALLTKIEREKRQRPFYIRSHL